MLSSTDEERIIENNKQIQRLLEENERILQKSGYTPPVNNLVLTLNNVYRFLAGIYGLLENSILIII